MESGGCQRANKDGSAGHLGSDTESPLCVNTSANQGAPLNKRFARTQRLGVKEERRNHMMDQALRLGNEGGSDQWDQRAARDRRAPFSFDDLSRQTAQ